MIVNPSRRSLFISLNLLTGEKQLLNEGSKLGPVETASMLQQVQSSLYIVNLFDGKSPTLEKIRAGHIGFFVIQLLIFQREIPFIVMSCSCLELLTII